MPSIPAKPASLRVRFWRRLQAVGAISIKNSVYVLPNRDESVETFEWIARELTDVGGQAALCEGQFVDDVTDDEIERRFVEARNADYANLSTTARVIAKRLKVKRLAPDRLDAIAASHDRIRQRLAEIIAVDFCDAPGRESAEGIVAANLRTLAALRSGGTRTEPLTLVERPRRAVWVTRTGVHVDRIASAWLIRRFIDPDATLKFVPAKGYVPARGELRFDMYDAEFTHVGDRCTFEVLLERMGIDDAGLTALGEIIHDIDIRDEKFAREETAGVRGAINGICVAQRDDLARIAATTPILEGLYAHFTQKRRR